MKYKGELYGKVGKKYILLDQTTDHIDAVAEHIEFVVKQLNRLICLFRSKADAYRTMGYNDLASSSDGIVSAYENAKSMLIEKKPEP